MVKILQIIGNRPNISKFVDITGKDAVVWTGQHYDPRLITGMPTPKYRSDLINVCLGNMQRFCEECIKQENPDLVVVYGDTRTALAGALAAKECGISLAHIEAGARCFDKNRPEEINRILIDQMSDYLFCSTRQCVKNLEDEGLFGVFVGDLHYDRYVKNRKHGGYIVATIHRAEHLKDKESLKEVLEGLRCDDRVFFYVHPNTFRKIENYKLKVPPNVTIMPPISYEEMQKAIKYAKVVITDSGGVSREAWFHGTPVRVIGKSEWEEINAFGEGDAGEKIRETLLRGNKCLAY